MEKRRCGEVQGLVLKMVSSTWCAQEKLLFNWSHVWCVRGNETYVGSYFYDYVNVCLEIV